MLFEYVRKHTKVMQIGLFVLILPSFVLFGIDGYSRMQEKGAIVATVDGKEILQSEWDGYHQREATRIRETMKQIDPKLLDTPEAKFASLERLVRDRVFAAAADKYRITTSDNRLARDLGENEAISTLRKADGTIDMVRYAELLSRQGMSPEMFEEQVRRDLALRQVVGGISAASMAPQAVVDRSLGAFYERREAQILKFSGGDYVAKVNLTDPDIQAYYDVNLTKFQAPETADIEYLVLDIEAVKRSLKLKPEEVLAYYEANKVRLATQEERRASHILINAGKDATSAVKSAARAKAADLLAQVRATPAQFGDLAKKNSEDAGSKDNGGDLDFFTRGSMVKPFEDKAFSMKKGEISDLVETDFGFHIIQITDVRAGRERAFEEAKADLENELRKQLAQAKFAEYAEPFTNSVFENADTLKTTADRFGLVVAMQTNVRRTVAPGATGMLGNARFLEAVFSSESINKKTNTPATDVGGNQIASARIVKYSPARQLPIAEVKDRVRMLATTEKSISMAKADGEKALASIKAGETPPGLSAVITISRDAQGEARQPPKVVEAVMRADAAKLPQTVGAEVPGFGYVVAKVSKVLPREDSGAERATNERKQVSEFWGAAEGMAYLNLLKAQFKVDVKITKPAAKAPEAL